MEGVGKENEMKATVYGYKGEVIANKTFRSHERLTDYLADVCGNDEHAQRAEVTDGTNVQHVNFDEQRDKAVLNGYILPVHKKRLAKGDEDDRRFLAELEAGRRHF